jgi:hypothetical protein
VKFGIGGILGCEGTVVVGGLGVFNPACGGIEGGTQEGGTQGSNVVGNAYDGGVGSLAFFCSELIPP